MNEYKDLLELITHEANNLSTNFTMINSLVSQKLVMMENNVTKSEEEFSKDISTFTPQASDSD